MPDHPIRDIAGSGPSVSRSETFNTKGLIKTFFTEDLDIRNELGRTLLITFLRFVFGIILTLSYLLLLKSVSFVPEQIVWGAAFCLSNVMAFPFWALLVSGYSRSVGNGRPYVHFFRRYSSITPSRKQGIFFLLTDIFIIWTICILAWPLCYVLLLPQMKGWFKMSSSH